jgi:hypothetical protein
MNQDDQIPRLPLRVKIANVAAAILITALIIASAYAVTR